MSGAKAKKALNEIKTLFLEAIAHGKAIAKIKHYPEGVNEFENFAASAYRHFEELEDLVTAWADEEKEIETLATARGSNRMNKSRKIQKFLEFAERLEAEGIDTAQIINGRGKVVEFKKEAKDAN